MDVYPHEVEIGNMLSLPLPARQADLVVEIGIMLTLPAPPPHLRHDLLPHRPAALIALSYANTSNN